MNSSDLRKEARNKLSGKWGKAALIALAYAVVFIVIDLVSRHLPESAQSIVSLIVTIIEIPLAFGLLLSLFKLYNDEEVNAFDFLSLGFSNFKKSWAVSLRIFVKMILPIILLIVSIALIIGGLVGTNTALLSDALSTSNIASLSASTTGKLSGVAILGFILYIVSIIWLIVRSYSYQLAFVIAADDDDLSSKEAIDRSAKLMNGNRWKLFCLQFSFIGWAIIACFTLGIGMLWLAPYIQFAIFAFYKYLNVDSKTVAEDTTSSVEDNINNPEK